MNAEEWQKLVDADPVLSRIGVDGLDALLTDEERAAVQDHLALMVNQQRRVEAESRGLALP